MRRTRAAAVLCAALCAAWAAPLCTADVIAALSSHTVKPGAVVQVEGTIPPGEELYVVLASETTFSPRQAEGAMEKPRLVKAGEQFGFERTGETIKEACEEDLSAEAIIDRILEAVAVFKGDATQSDDMTCVVLRIE